MRLRGALVVALVVLLALPALAVAERGAAVAQRERSASARFEAAGTGEILMRGRLVTYGVLSAPGRLVVRDLTGDAVVSLDGETLQASPRGWIRVRRAEGRFYVSGTLVSVGLEGDISLAAAGRGQAAPRGEGTYRLNGGDPAPWDGETVRIAPDRSQAAGAARRARERG